MFNAVCCVPNIFEELQGAQPRVQRPGPGAQHCFQTPSVAVIGRQCHIQPSARRAAPTFSVLAPPAFAVAAPLFTAFSFVASFAKVPMISEAKQTHSSLWSR